MVDPLDGDRGGHGASRSFSRRNQKSHRRAIAYLTPHQPRARSRKAPSDGARPTDLGRLRSVPGAIAAPMKEGVMASRSHTHSTPVRTSGPQAARNPTFVAGAVAVGLIWIAVVAISLFAPDMVTGSEQDRAPIAALLTWIWGLIASRNLILTLMAGRDRPEQVRPMRVLSAAVAFLWVAAAVIAVFGPESVSGADPTRIPVAALIAPIAAMVLTTTASQLFRAFTRTPMSE